MATDGKSVEESQDEPEPNEPEVEEGLATDEDEDEATNDPVDDPEALA